MPETTTTTTTRSARLAALMAVDAALLDGTDLDHPTTDPKVLRALQWTAHDLALQFGVETSEVYRIAVDRVLPTLAPVEISIRSCIGCGSPVPDGRLVCSRCGVHFAVVLDGPMTAEDPATVETSQALTAEGNRLLLTAGTLDLSHNERNEK